MASTARLFGQAMPNAMNAKEGGIYARQHTRLLAREERKNNRKCVGIGIDIGISTDVGVGINNGIGVCIGIAIGIGIL